MKKILSILIALTAGMAHASPLSEYSVAAQAGVLNCAAEMQRAKLRQSLTVEPAWEKIGACIDNEVDVVKKAHAVASKSLGKNTKAQFALKEHLVKVITQLRGVDVQSGERVRDYEQRQSTLKSGTDEAWARVEVEL